MSKKAVVLLSGGLDSATTLAIAQELGYLSHALSFRYGQRHVCELEAAKRIGKELAGVEGRQRLTIHTPLIQMTKAEIIQKGRALGVDYSHTHSCYDPDASCRPCGMCDSCHLRRNGFREAGLEDPLEYPDA